ncbi:glycosyltransferase family 2 protein [Planosporangium flavigriseum]|uniref:Glucosyl transferase n=1 Tax=Planosporangium flavigriseum TaxID=373681 RepID=A0A8J3M2C9_9ACTN|nr:glycosyltransferase family 2 protein [Planosporangium flavigriseum]NJC67350.1 glycosyltransferase family 2 protein [Planosporangium flavigriseum]GIG75435.1 glucosyl transferase [Planosporangium flavigriseum]
MSAADSPLLSVVVPMYNEEEVIPLFIERLRPVLDTLGDSYEVLTVDDGSVDATPQLLLGLRRVWPQVRVIRLRRNSGHQAALTAGLHSARGAYVVSIDADLQDPPEKILEMLTLARARNLDIVYGVRTDRSTDTFFKRITAGLYYTVMRRCAGRAVSPNAGDFRLLSRATVDVLKTLPEHQPVYRLLVPWMGFPSGEVTYAREQRAAGRTKYPLSKMIRLALDSVTNFSASPLRLATWLGMLTFAGCLALACFSVARHLLGFTVPGWTSLFLVVLFTGGVQLVCLGLLGEYVGRIHSALQRRPAYFIAYDTADPAGASTPTVPRLPTQPDAAARNSTAAMAAPAKDGPR